MDAGEKTFGDMDTLRGVTGGAAWQAAEGLTFGDLETLRDEGVVLAGRYKVVKRLGEGGMGSVWLAEDAKLDGRKVAVKMLPAILVGKKGAYRQVKAEAMVAMKLSHPNIATVRAFEEDEGGNPFLVMDYVEGEGLDDILAEKGALGEEETLRILGPVAAALDYAHGKGVVHRDVKPGNVMVAKDGTPFVLDFGIAREIQETMTRVTGKFSSGTLLYMSPEQLNGDAPKAAQDVYSFAAMAYECLSGHAPFFRGAIEDQIKNKTPEDLPEGVGKALRAGVMAGLAKEPEKRPGSCVGVLGEKVEGQRPKVEGRGGDLATGDGRLGKERGDRESRFADPESRGTAHDKREGGRTARPEGSLHQQGGDSDGDVFLMKIRVGKELEAAGREEATAAEGTALGKIREVFAAGEEALRTGDKRVAGELFGRAKEELSGWKTDLAGRRDRERREEEARRERKREELEAAERKRHAEEAERAEEARKQAEAQAVKWRVAWGRVAKVAGVVALGWWGWWALAWNEWAVCRSIANQKTRKAVAGLGTGTHEGEEKTITFGWNADMTFVWCPPGSFLMGSPEEEPGRYKHEIPHRVTLTKGFWMAKTEVTQRQWKSVMGNNPSWFKGDDLPVECVSWNDCQEFCRKTGLQLPTEAQWEYACRAGSTGEYAGNLEEMGWYADNSGGKTHQVGQKQPNAWGLYDMHGNVWEWCADRYGDYPNGPVTDPPGVQSGPDRVRRGGSWSHNARGCRSACRGRNGPDLRHFNRGLRVALLPVP